MHELESTPGAPAEWEQLRPLIDGAIDELGARDREAVVLRFFAQRSFAQIGDALNVSEDAARMRVERALAKLPALLARHGITSTSTALGTAFAHQGLVAAPAGLSTSVQSARAETLLASVSRESDELLARLRATNRLVRELDRRVAPLGLTVTDAIAR